MEFASKAVGNAGLATGIVGSALGAANSGILNGLFGNNQQQTGDNTYVNRYEMSLTQQIESERAKNALLEAHIYTDNKTDEKVRELGDRVYSDIREIRDQVCHMDRRISKNEQENAVFAAGMNGVVSCMQQQINQLFGLTKLSIPNGSVCPGWGNVTITPAAATTTTTTATT